MPFFISKPIFPGTWGVLSGAKSWFRFWFLTPCPAIQLTVFIGVQRGKIWTAELCWLLIRKLCKNLTQPPFLNDGSHVIKKQRSKKVSKTVGVVIISSNLAQYSQLQRRGEKKLIQGVQKGRVFLFLSSSCINISHLHSSIINGVAGLTKCCLNVSIWPAWARRNVRNFSMFQSGMGIFF